MKHRHLIIPLVFINGSFTLKKKLAIRFYGVSLLRNHRSVPMKSRRSHEEIVKNFTCNRTRCVHYARAGARASTGLPLITFFFVFHSFDVDSFVVAVPPIKMSNCKFMLGAEWIKFLIELSLSWSTRIFLPWMEGFIAVYSFPKD